MLTTSDLQRILDFLADCEGRPDLADFRGTVTEAFARHFGLRNTTFFRGAAWADLNDDVRPVATGKAAPMMPSYVEKYRRLNPFDLTIWTKPGNIRPIALEEVLRRRPIHPAHRHYVDNFLFRNRIHDMLVIPLIPVDLDDRGGSGAIGWLVEEAGTFGPRAIATARVLQQHLTALFRTHAAEAAKPDPLAGLSPRQRQVAELVAQGRTNQEIADTLYVSVDTVKKHVTQALRETGCASRTQLAVSLGQRRR